MGLPIVAVDIDEVLFPLSPRLIAWHNATHNTAYTLEDNVTYVLGEVWGNTYADSVEKIHRFLALDHRPVAPVPYASEGIAALRQQFTLAVVTSRDSQLESGTVAWLSEHFPHAFAEVIFAGNQHTGLPFRSKAAVCQDLGAIALIDDSLSAVGECAARGIGGILFGDSPWNQLERLPSGVTRARDWTEVTDILLAPGQDPAVALLGRA